MSADHSSHFTRSLAVLAVSGSLVAAMAGSAMASTPPPGSSSPTVELTAPTGGSVRGTVAISATAAASAGVRSVEFFVDGRSIGSDTTAPYHLDRDTRQLPDGVKTVTARVTDRNGRAAVSAARQVRISNTTTGTGVPGPMATATPTSTPTPTATPSVTPTPTPTPTPTTASDPAATTDGFGVAAAPRVGIFTTSSFWRQSVRAAPVGPNSAAIVADLTAQVARNNGGNASLNVWQYNANVLTVPADQPRVRVAFNDCQHKGYTPKGLFGAGGQFEDVPVPDAAMPSAGTDAAFSIWSPSTDQFWDLWKAAKTSTGWSACWGGRIDDVTSSPGYFLNGFGTSASGVAGVAGMLSIRDMQYGRADHAIAVGIPDPASYKTLSWPAQRSDGSSSSTSTVMEGQRFKLDPTVDVEALPMSALGKVVARAAQEYGLVVAEKSGTVAIAAENGAGVQAATGTNPWNGFMGTDRRFNKSYNALAGFPWNRLQALPTDYGKPMG